MFAMNWDRLGKEVVQRRGRLGFPSRREFAEATGFPAKTLSDLETHKRENFDRSTLARLESALQWPAGTIDAILGGEDPVSVESLSLDPRSLERYGDDQELLALIESAGLSPADKFRVALRVRRRRAEQHAELVAELRHMLGLPDGDDTEETG